MALTHAVVIDQQRMLELYPPYGRATAPLHNRNTFRTITLWCDLNTPGYTIENAYTYVFEREEDAVLFKLTWC